MTLLVLAYLGGVLTIVSPCILPVLPFVFARADRPFLQSGLPMLVGMAVTFAVIATLAAVAGGWVVEANQYGRIAAIALLAVFGLTLCFPKFADRVMEPLVAPRRAAVAIRSTVTPNPGFADLAFVVARGCDRASLGAVRGAGPWPDPDRRGPQRRERQAPRFSCSPMRRERRRRSRWHSLVGGRIFAAMKRSLGAGEWIRRGLGVAVLVAVAAIAFGSRHRLPDSRFAVGAPRRSSKA